MRRGKQQLSTEETKEIFSRQTSGVLALAGDAGYPYAVPMSYVYDGAHNRLIFHSALSGHKVDSIKRCSKASFCTISQDDVIPDEYATSFKSVIAFGTIRILGGDEARDAAELLGEKYRPGYAEDTRETVSRNLSRMIVFVLDIEHMTGKQAKNENL